MGNKPITLHGHIVKETDFWITVHCPNSGMIFDFMKKDLIPFKERLVPLDELAILEFEQKVYEEWILDDENMKTPYPNYLIKAICSRFATRVTSVEEILAVMVEHTKSEDGDHSGIIIGREFPEVATAIHNLFTGEKK